jgi:hypothetical protein
MEKFPESSGDDAIRIYRKSIAVIPSKTPFPLSGKAFFAAFVKMQQGFCKSATVIIS